MASAFIAPRRSSFASGTSTEIARITRRLATKPSGRTIKVQSTILIIATYQAKVSKFHAISCLNQHSDGNLEGMHVSMGWQDP